MTDPDCEIKEQAKARMNKFGVAVELIGGKIRRGTIRSVCDNVFSFETHDESGPVVMEYPYGRVVGIGDPHISGRFDHR